MADNTWNVAQLAEIAAINAEIQGMIAENLKCVQNNIPIVYDETSFAGKVHTLHWISENCMRER